jgi:hypothetical protein
MLTFSAGCIFSPKEPTGDGPDIDPDPTLEFPGSRDALMRNFRVIYETLDFEAFADMMHEDYFMILQQSTIDEFPGVGLTIDLSQELRMHERMFSGDSLFDPDTGLAIPGISSISFGLFDQISPWTLSPLNDPIPDADFSEWDVNFTFDRAGFTTLSVEGTIVFYATSRDSLHEGIVQQYWQMVGQKDNTDD